MGEGLRPLKTTSRPRQRVFTVHAAQGGLKAEETARIIVLGVLMNMRRVSQSEYCDGRNPRLTPALEDSSALFYPVLGLVFRTLSSSIPGKLTIFKIPA